VKTTKTAVGYSQLGRELYGFRTVESWAPAEPGACWLTAIT
jgi:hypothetical protein